MEKSGWGNNIYLFLKINFLLLVYLLIWSVESKFIPCYTVKKLQN